MSNSDEGHAGGAGVSEQVSKLLALLDGGDWREGDAGGSAWWVTQAEYHELERLTDVIRTALASGA